MKNNLVSIDSILKKAYLNHYAVPHVNTNNYEWTKAILSAANEMNSPIIIGVSEGAVKYMSGYKNVVDIVKNIMDTDDINIPVCLHLDHGTFDGCKQAILAGFSSIMFDGSKISIQENINKINELKKIIGNKNISLEAEVGSIGGEEDGNLSYGELANIEDCKKISGEKISCLAAGIGNIHGIYPNNWEGLNFELLSKINNIVKIPLVLHGGTGIPLEQIKKAISLGIAKINVNTECQLAFAAALRNYFEAKKDLDLANKGFDPRKLLKPGVEAIKNVVVEKITLFGSKNKA